LPSTTAHATSRARGNLRFKQVINQLSGLADCQILDVTITEVSADAQATALTFTVKYDRDEFIPLTGTKQGVTVVGNDAANAVMDTPAKAIANAVSSGLYNGTTEMMRVYNPTTGEGTDQKITANANATQAQLLGKVTVTLIDTTTVINS
jgi:hypothetical protein